MATSLVNNKYRITRRIGGGSFGEIYMGIGPNNEKIAVKFERHGTRCPQLRHEYKVYRELANCHGFCAVYHFGQQDNYNVMVMDLLGPSLEDLFNKCQRRFSLKTVLQLADQMLERVDTLHSRHLIHRDIKPANFVIGLGDQGANVYCVDFGLSKRYRHPKSLQHIPHRDGRSLTGTPRYASINNHLGIEQSRRDDLESIGYVLVYFLKGTLPWQGLKAKNAQKKYRMILEKKQQVSIAQLCQGCPSQFAEFLGYARTMKFDAKPDIPYIRKTFRDLYHAQGCASVGKLWDWDHIDTDFMTAGPGTGSEGGPPILSNTMRPTTGAAVGGDMHGGDEDMGTHEDMHDEEYGMRGKQERPASSSALPSASGKQPVQQQQLLTSSWGFSRQQPPAASDPSQGMAKDPRVMSAGADYGMGSGIADPSQKRPHTAHGGRAPGATATDLRKAPGGPGSMEEEEGDGHVVAGARAMMRYRRTRATDGSEGSGVGAPQQVAQPNSGRGTWTGDGAPSGQPIPRGYSAQGQPAQAGRSGSGSGASGGIAAAPQASMGYGQVQQKQAAPQQQQQQQQYIVQRDKVPSTTGWLGSGGILGGDRPKSAGLMSTLTGGAARNTVAASAGAGAGPSAGAQGLGTAGSKTKSSKLFSLSR